MNFEYILLGALAIINISAFTVVVYDKRISRRGGDTERDRIPEGLIFFMASALGAVGTYLGMLAFRHKTRKWYFQLGIPLMILQNLAVVYLIREILLEATRGI